MTDPADSPDDTATPRPAGADPTAAATDDPKPATGERQADENRDADPPA